MSDQLIDSFVAFYHLLAVGVIPKVLPLTLALATSLFMIHISYQGSIWALTGQERVVERMAGHTVLFLIFLGLIGISPSLLYALFSGFDELGIRLTGVRFTPSHIWGQGINLAITLYDSWSKILSFVFGPAKLIRIFSFWIILASFGFIAGRVALILIEVSVAISGGLIFLGFATHRLTWEITAGYLRYCLELGVKLYLLLFVVALASKAGEQWDQILSGAALFDVRVHLSILFSAVFIAFLSWKLPNTLAQRIASSFRIENPFTLHE